MKIATIIGTRPQFIKAAALCRAIQLWNRQNDHIQEVVIHTGQHYDSNMSDIFFHEMEIPTPNYHLGIGGGTQGAMTGRMIEKIEEILIEEKPDWVVVFGDTNSTLAGALAAVKMHIPVAHVEAGLRSFNRKMPEEINRLLTDHCSDVLFTPTTWATKQLIREDIPEDKISQVGDVMYDAFLFYKKKAFQKTEILKKSGIKPKQYALATIHRAENTDDSYRLKEICHGLMKISEKMPVVLPLHPRTKKSMIRDNLLQVLKSTVIVIDPVGYLEMILLESESRVILTDSGGVQKEAYFLNVPCITLRDETEWMELVEHGYNHLVPPEANKIFNQFHSCLNSFNQSTSIFYGDGDSAHKIINEVIKRYLSN